VENEAGGCAPPAVKSLALANGGIAVDKVSLAVSNARRQGVLGKTASYGIHFFRCEVTSANPAKNTIVVIHLSSFCDFL
jgi:hypothetical protein